MSGLRQGWLVALREMRERSRSRGFRAGLVVMLLVVVAMIVVPAMLDTGPGPRTSGSPAAIPAELPRPSPDKATTVDVTVRVHRFDDVAAGEEAVRDQDVDVLVVDARRLEWRGEADEQLRAVVTGAIQLVAVQERAAAAGITPTTCSPWSTPCPSRTSSSASLAGRSPDDEPAADRDDRPVADGHHHLREPGPDRRRGGEVQPGRRGAAGPHARPQPARRQGRRHRTARVRPVRRDRAGRADRHDGGRLRRPPGRQRRRARLGRRCGSCSATPSTPWPTGRSARWPRGPRTRRASPGPSATC